MTPVLVSVDKAGDLKLGRKKCRLHKKADVVKVAKKYGIVQAEKLTIKEMCEGLKMRAKNSPPREGSTPPCCQKGCSH